MVVKCTQCTLFFSLTDTDKKCPFCKTEHIEVAVEVTAEAAIEGEEKSKEKKGASKTQKGSFKLWKSS